MDGDGAAGLSLPRPGGGPQDRHPNPRSARRSAARPPDDQGGLGRAGGGSRVAIGLLVLLSFGGLFVLDAIGAESITVGEPGTPTFLFEYVNTFEEISVSVGSGVLVLGALLGLVYSFTWSYLRIRRPASGEKT